MTHGKEILKTNKLCRIGVRKHSAQNLPDTPSILQFTIEHNIERNMQKRTQRIVKKTILKVHSMQIFNKNIISCAEASNIGTNSNQLSALCIL